MNSSQSSHLYHDYADIAGSPDLFEDDDLASNGDNATSSDTVRDTRIIKLCDVVRKGYSKQGLLVQVGLFEDGQIFPGLLIGGQCTTCKNSKNKCFHTRVYKFQGNGAEEGETSSFLSYCFYPCVVCMSSMFET